MKYSAYYFPMKTKILTDFQIYISAPLNIMAQLSLALLLPNCNILYRGKKVGEKWLNFLQVTKFFPDFLFPDQYFSLIFFHLRNNLSRFFLPWIIIIISHLFAKFIIAIFFWCTLSIFNNNFEIRVKARNWKK